MKKFQCLCGASIFFENTHCLQCSRELGFLPDELALCALAPSSDAESDTTYGRYRKCANNLEHEICNWMVRSTDSNPLCRACRLNRVIPDLSQPENLKLWAEVERAKRRLIYGLARLKLPLRSKAEAPERGLAFDIKADEGATRVLTGHSEGLITLNLAEANAAERERMRTAMHEPYRTLLGHFRHEIGHYYWGLWVNDDQFLVQFRRLFGDETVDYADAIAHHYAAEPKRDYADAHVSAYASAHPWEDFAETFAHYLHLEDTLETAHEFGLTSHVSQRTSIVEVSRFEPLMAEWNELVIVLNELNRSMGQPDAYPFAISARVRAKLEFVHSLICAARS